MTPPNPPFGSLAELHRHLDGSIRPATLAQLVANHDKTVPADLPFSKGMGLEAALARFAFTLSVLQEPDAVRRVAAEMCEDAQEEGISTLEIRFAPQLHAGGPMEAIIDAVLEGVDGRAGILLCALYGDSPGLVSQLVEAACARTEVVGIDLAGGPAPSHDFSMEDYGPAFRRARELGIGRTVHAGEGRPPAEIRTAIETLHAQRIGHGTTLLDDPEVLDLVLERGITIEACPTSNVHTGVIPEVSEHPLKQWLDRGVKVTVCTDNTLLSAVTLPQELERVRAIEGIDDEAIARCMTHGHAAAFTR
jgi:adenosine deaminase